jgi:Flp pilus assembly protein TadB
MAKLPYSFLTRDRFGPSRVLASPRGRYAHPDHALSQPVRWEDAPGRTISTERRRWLLASLHSLYAVSLALATVVVLLWRGSLLLLAAGAFVLGVLTVVVFLVVAHRAGARRGKTRHYWRWWAP